MTAFRGRDERGAGKRDRLAGEILITRENDFNRRTVERAGVGERFQRKERHDVAALHVDDARPERLVALAAKRRCAVLALEHRIEMADEKEFPAAIAFAARDEMAGAVHLRRKGFPADIEAELGEGGLELGADRPDALMAHRARTDADNAFKKKNRFVGAGGDGVAHGLLFRPNRGGGGGKVDRESGGDGEQ